MNIQNLLLLIILNSYQALYFVTLYLHAKFFFVLNILIHIIIVSYIMLFIFQGFCLQMKFCYYLKIILDCIHQYIYKKDNLNFI